VASHAIAQHILSNCINQGKVIPDEKVRRSAKRDACESVLYNLFSKGASWHSLLTAQALSGGKDSEIRLPAVTANQDLQLTCSCCLAGAA
jgi:hypothetical protein